MSLLAKLFGGKSTSGGGKPPTPQEAIQRLRDVEETLQKKSDFLEKKIEEEIKVAKQYAVKNKRAALQALKRKKRIEQQLRQIDGTLSTIEFQREALENASTNTEVLNVMGVAAKALKQVHKNMDVDKVHDLMDEVAEQHEVANEIGEAISRPVGFGSNIDEDELNAELEELAQEDLDTELLKIEEQTPKLPEVPTDKPLKVPAKKVPQTDQDDEMAQLASWAN